MKFTESDLADLLQTATGLKETFAAPEEGPYYLHDLVHDEAKLAAFIEIMVPVARALIQGPDPAQVAMIGTIALTLLNDKELPSDIELARLKQAVTRHFDIIGTIE